MTAKRDRSAKIEGVALVTTMWGLVALMVFLIALILRDRQLSKESPSWPVVSGVVVSALVEETTGYRTGHGCHPDVRYVYAVGGTTFKGRRVDFRPAYGCGEAREIVERHAPGTPVSVHYRPSDPGTAILVPDSWEGVFLLVILTPVTVLVLFGALILTAFVRSWFFR